MFLERSEEEREYQERMDRELIERFPHVSLHSGKDGHKITSSTGHELDLGKVHPAAMEFLMSTISFINRLSQDPGMISYDRLKDEYGK